ncbi:MAG: two-component system regulatory protein YycI [Vagococcus sp.]|uniref:two-component system regulatory protein YycI n=1 Tax=Vagococcus sp. TaxID=1933889 RepID=UPI002FC7FE62
MDFKRVEGIFLVVFLFLNMFLFYVYQEGKTSQDTISTGTISDNIEERLTADEIKIPHKLSDKNRQGYYLSAEESELVVEAKAELKSTEWQVNDSQLTARPIRKNEMEIADSDESKKVEAFISQKQNVVNGKDYVLNRSETKPGKNYVYNQAWEKIPFYDETSRLSLMISKNDLNRPIIESYEQTYLNNIEPLREQQAVISEREAIISLYTNNRLQPSNKIKWINLAYTRIFTVRGKNVYIPAWFVAVESNKNSVQIERVNAFSSAVISSNISEVKN